MKQRCTTAWGLLGLLGLALAALATFTPADAAPASQPSPQDQAQLESLNSELAEEEEKRSWNSLHGGWGKRAWSNLHGGWGKRGWQDMNSAWGKRAWSNLHGGWGKRAWNSLQGGWGKRDATNPTEAELLDLLSSPPDRDYLRTISIDSYAPIRQALNSNAERMLEADNDMEAEKKSWSSLHGTWGKRSGERWSNLRGSMGKREPGWNNLKGLWGKRSTLDSLEDSQNAYLDRQDE